MVNHKYFKEITILLVLSLCIAIFIYFLSARVSDQILPTTMNSNISVEQADEARTKVPTTESTCCTEEQSLASYQEMIAQFDSETENIKTYQNTKYGFTFNYPANWALKEGRKLIPSTQDYTYEVTLTNTKDFPLRKQSVITVVLHPNTEEDWMNGGGEGVEDVYMQLKNTSSGETMKFGVYQETGIGLFYEKADDEVYKEKFYAEGAKASRSFGTVIKSLKAL